jgi:GDP-4-dehydro-6-deoxy-D-mannose reductase
MATGGVFQHPANVRVFVTGSAGFVGRRLVARLPGAGHEPVGVDREYDVTDPGEIDRVLTRTRPEAVVHLAALSSVAGSWKDPGICFRVNFLGTRHLLESVSHRSPEARVLLVGSADAYGGGAPGAPPFRENDPLSPRSPYARSKAAAEMLGRLAAEAGLDVLRLRPFNHTGAGQSDTFVASSFARQVVEIAEGRREPRMQVGNLDSVREFLDVEDVIDAYLALLDPEAPADVYNVARGQGMSIRALLDCLLELGGVDPRIERDPERFRPTDVLVGDPTRLQGATGWWPRREIQSTLESLLEDWRRRLSAS